MSGVMLSLFKNLPYAADSIFVRGRLIILSSPCGPTNHKNKGYWQGDFFILPLLGEAERTGQFEIEWIWDVVASGPEDSRISIG